jgi:Hsp70 protein
MAGGARIGIDFGTSHTVALLAWPDGRVRPLLFDGSPVLPSSVYAQPDGRLLVGRDAVHAARVDPSRFEASPKRRIDDGSVLLGEQEFPVPALIAGVLTTVAQEAARVAGGMPAALTLTHPASWGVSRRLALVEGAKLAGLPQPALMPEPVAAAQYFAGVLGKQLAQDQGLLIYDFGGGTFDASMVVRNGEGFDVRAVDGIDDLGGVDLDALIVEYAKEQVPDPELWQRLTNPQSTDDRRSLRLLWDDARAVKEMLSRSDSASMHVPIATRDVTMFREEFEQRARPLLEQTVRTTNAVLRWSNVDKSHLAGVFLVGGSSRVPIVATLLERELGIAPTAIEQPELVVGEGSLWTAELTRAQQGQTALARATAQVSAPPIPQPQGPPPQAPVSPSPIYPVSGQPVSSAPVSPPYAAPSSGIPVSPPYGPPTGTTPSNGIPVSPAGYMQPQGLSQPPPPQAPQPPPDRNAPVWPGPGQAGQPPNQMRAPMPPPTVYPPITPAYGAPPVPGKKRNVIVPVLAGLLVLSLVLAGYVLLRGKANPKKTNAGDSSTTTAAPNPTGGTQGQQNYQRQSRPSWVPESWQSQPDRTADKIWISQDENEGGHCEAGQTLHVQTGSNPLTGCQLRSPLADQNFADVAIEVQVTVASGCAGLWTRTGSKGYLLRVCRDRAELHLLKDAPPSDATRLAQATFPTPATGALVVALEAQGTTLTGYVNGEDVLHAQNGEVTRGKVNAGATADGGNAADVTFDGFRVFAPPAQQNNPNPNQTKKHPSPTSSPTWDTTPSEPPPTTWQPTPTS